MYTLDHSLRHFKPLTQLESAAVDVPQPCKLLTLGAGHIGCEKIYCCAVHVGSIRCGNLGGGLTRGWSGQCSWEGQLAWAPAQTHPVAAALLHVITHSGQNASENLGGALVAHPKCSSRTLGKGRWVQ